MRSHVLKKPSQKSYQPSNDEAFRLLDLPFHSCSSRLQYNPQVRILLCDTIVVRLTPSENSLFQGLLEYPGQVVATQALKKRHQFSLQMVRQHLGTLRQKLWVCELDVECIYGKGYRLSTFALDHGHSE